MNQILYENRCKCNEEFSITKNESTTRSEGKPLQYPKSNEITSKTFQNMKRIIFHCKIYFE
jgi:hypothetical protein